ncbi:MAG TPA: hypothetical protein VHK65_06510 [Candidatus Dormibacteraeota bacterium]|nr:hypothetical protein [Candidatus Dormibacteraeota bacterium]
MITLTPPIPDERRPFAAPIEAMQRAAEAVGQASLAELRAQIDATYTFMADQFILKAQAGEQTTATRLVRKLLALRERLVYSEFGAAEQYALRSVLYDLDELVELHAFKGGTTMAQIPVGDQTPLPPPPDTATTSQGSYYLRWKLYRAQGSLVAADAQPTLESKPTTATKP